MQYLIVENKGTFGIDFISVTGASTSRGREDMIGQFGSGSEYAFALALRKSLDVRYTSGVNAYTFAVDERKAKDVLGHTRHIREVIMKQVSGSSRKTRPMGFEESFGEIDWKDIYMALREWVSNACDASMTLQGDYKGVRVELVDEPTRWAREGYTRVYIQANDEVRDFYENLHMYFPLLKAGFDVKQVIIPKEEYSPLRVYRKGVMVGKFDEDSMYDYNLNDIELKESRTISEYAARHSIAMAFKSAASQHVAALLRAIEDGVECYETKNLDHSQIGFGEWEKGWNDKRKKEWTEGIKRAFGDAVACDNTRDFELVARKGHKPVLLSDTMCEVLRSYEMPTANEVLDDFEVNGREKIEINDQLMARLQWLWNELAELGMTKDKEMPPIEGFHDVMNAGCRVLGYHDPKRDVVGINSDIFDSEFEATQTMLEEFCHFVTKAKDGSRDVQDFGFKLATLLLLKMKSK